METVVDLEPAALERAWVLANERGVSIGKVLGDALLGHHLGLTKPDDIKAMIAEDEVWEITRGDPHHSFHKPIVTTDEQGFPQVEIGRALTLEEVRAAVDEE